MNVQTAAANDFAVAGSVPLLKVTSIQRAVMVTMKIVCILLALELKPKSEPLQFHNSYVGEYRYGVFLKRDYFRVVVSEANCGTWTVDVRGAGYNRYRGHYADGTLKEEGEIFVEYFGDEPLQPVPDRHLVKQAKYFSPDGKLASEVHDGTGEQLLFYPNGKLRWRLQLVDYKQRYLEYWNEKGESLFRKTYE